MYSVRMSEYTPDLVDDDSGLFPDETTTHDFQSSMFTLYSLPTMHCYPVCSSVLLLNIIVTRGPPRTSLVVF